MAGGLGLAVTGLVEGLKEGFFLNVSSSTWSEATEVK
jgi:hypothetical protein